jgi:hypothetical protein
MVEQDAAFRAEQDSGVPADVCSMNAQTSVTT